MRLTFSMFDTETRL